VAPVTVAGVRPLGEPALRALADRLEHDEARSVAQLRRNHEVVVDERLERPNGAPVTVLVASSVQPPGNTARAVNAVCSCGASSV
jgi:hypothetical protein